MRFSFGDPLASELLSGELTEGDSHRVDADDNRERLPAATRDVGEPDLEA